MTSSPIRSLLLAVTAITACVNGARAEKPQPAAPGAAAPLPSDLAANAARDCEGWRREQARTGRTDAAPAECGRIRASDVVGLGPLATATDAGALTGILAVDRLPRAAAISWSGAHAWGGATRQWWAQNGARIHRMNDRLFLGAAVDNDGAYPNAALDWLSAYQKSWGGFPVGYPTGALVASLVNPATEGRYALLGAAQSFKSSGVHSAAIGVAGFGLANATPGSGPGASAWGGYFEAIAAEGGGGGASAVEVDAIAFRPTITPSITQLGDVRGHQVACGGEYVYAGKTLYDCSNAISIKSNGAKFKKGIIIHAASVTPGSAALDMPTNNPIEFHDTTGNVARINATFNGVSPGHLTFTQIGAQFSGPDASSIAYFVPIAGAANWLTFMGAPKGGAPTVAAAGNDANATLRLAGKGAGGVVLAGQQANHLYASGSAPAGGGVGLAAAGADANINLLIAPKGAGTTDIKNVRLAPTTFAALPTCAAATKGVTAYITDAGAAITSWRQQVTSGGGAHESVVICNGAGWFAIF